MLSGIGWRFRRRLPAPRTDDTAALSHWDLSRAVVELAIDPKRDSIRQADAIVSGRFEFLNRVEQLPVIDWTKTYVNPLWTYNLHYFDFAVDLALAFHLTGKREYVATFQRLTVGWITATEAGQGVAWDPYPISVRTVNWLYALSILGDSVTNEIRTRITDSVFRQLCALEGRIERHLLGNHVVRNLRALAIGGLFLEGERPTRWSIEAVSALWEEAQAQVLTDGVHFERSPMYHAIVLSDLLELIHLSRTAQRDVPPEIEQMCRRMSRALYLMSRRGEVLRLFNDSSDRIAASLRHLQAMAERVLNVPIPPVMQHWSLPDSGYHGYRDAADRCELVVTCREPSPEFQPGHSHCDILSFEWDLAGEQVIVDSGVHGYDGDPYREYVRSTRAHNTVVIAGEDQSEPWSTFRFARRATDVTGKSKWENGKFVFEGSYRPYHDRTALHRRRIVAEGETLAVTDVIESSDEVLIENFLHFHPSWSVSLVDNGAVAENGPLTLSVKAVGTGEMEVVSGSTQPNQGWYCPEFGKAVSQDVLVMRHASVSGAEFGYIIRPLRPNV